MAFAVAIVGRPNVGKSTLFNRLTGRRSALVDDTPGVTRDWRQGAADVGGIAFNLIDTAGLDEAAPDALETRMREQTLSAMRRADVILFVVDARVGVTPLDEHFAKMARGADKPVVLVANKCEGAAAVPGLMEAFSLGLGEPIACSAEHGEGIADLVNALAASGAPRSEELASGADSDDVPIHLAIVGRPNVGKSTLVNRLIGEERLLTGPEAGITRDAIDVVWHVEGREVVLTDTAGQRRQARVGDKLERLAVADAKRSVDYAEVVLLVIDAGEGLEKQDLTIASRTVEEGRALLIAINKWDLAEDRDRIRREVSDRLERSLTQVRGVPVLTVSALTGEGLKRLLPTVLAVYQRWNKRVPTAQLNRWLADATERHPPPAVAGRRIKFRYVTQPKGRPPTFVLFCSRPKEVPASYERYLANDLREHFGLEGVPVRLLLRKGENPYAKKS